MRGVKMRWVKRLLLFWLVAAPLGYVFGLPYGLQLLSEKVQRDARTQCYAQLTQQGLLGSGAPFGQAQADAYCACVSDGLLFTEADLKDVLQKKPPATLTAKANAQAETCNQRLQQALRSGIR